MIFEDLNIRWLGRCDYEEGLEIQNQAVENVKKTSRPEILTCEHPTVITLGKRGQPLTDILTSMDVLREQNIKIVATDRGGQATLHNPGQLVIYPIIPLRQMNLGVRTYVECLERATAHYLAEYGMEVTRGYEPGLFVENKKIAAFGIRVDRGVTLHGLAINLNNDLESFSLIRQCGQIVKPTNLQTELEAIGVAKIDWNFREEGEKWKGLFAAELNDLVRDCERGIMKEL
jgi:lipoyl(octanoyl) transferase